MEEEGSCCAVHIARLLLPYTTARSAQVQRRMPPCGAAARAAALPLRTCRAAPLRSRCAAAAAATAAARCRAAVLATPLCAPRGRRAARTPRDCRASADRGAEADLLDPDMREALNDVSSRAVRAMLAGNAASVAALRAELAATVAELRAAGAADETAAAELFLATLAEMLDHRLLPAAEQLQGPYARALSAVLTAVEGEWKFSVPGQPDGPAEQPRYETWEARPSRRVHGR
jgi:hypothetical protein